MTEAPTSANPERDKAIRTAYANATKRLREEQRDRFRELQIEEAQKLGVDYKPQPTKDEKAEAMLAALLAENPALKARLVDELKQQG